MIRRTTLVIFALLMLSVVVTLAGCNGKTPVTPTGVVGLPVISSFSVSPTTGPAGTIATLTWSVTGTNTRVGITTTAGINPGTGFATSGSTTVSPTATATYTLTATNPASGDSVSATATFVVK